jgi:hypothetical protein
VSGPDPEWEWNDGWMLVAIDGSRRGTELTDVVSSLDAHNHAIPHEHEAARSIGRLVASGLVQVDGRYRLTDEGRRIQSRKTGSMFAMSTSLHDVLRAEVPLVEGRWTFAPGEWDAACDAWTERAARWMRSPLRLRRRTTP